MNRIIKVKDLVQDMVDKGATSVEEIHKAIADMPFDALKRIDPTDNATDTVRKAHHDTIGGVYEIIRKINRKVGELAGEILDGAADIVDDSENY